jgi:hypothetical protein
MRRFQPQTNPKEKNMKKLHLLTLVAALACAGTAHAQFTGGVAVGGSGAYTYDAGTGGLTLTFAATNLYEGGDGTFASIPTFPPTLDLVSATNLQVNGLTLGQSVTLGTPVVFDFASASTPVNEYALDINSIDVTNAPTGPLGPVFTATGTFVDVDSGNNLTPTALTLTGSFSGPNSYSFSASVVATPEPSSWALALGCAGLFAYLRRRAARA